MGSFEVRVTILNQGDSYQRTLSVFIKVYSTVPGVEVLLKSKFEVCCE